MTKREIRQTLTAAEVHGRVLEAYEGILMSDRTGDGAAYAREWLGLYGAGTWQARALAQIDALATV